MSNQIRIEEQSIQNANAIFDTLAPTDQQVWISPQDIGALAAIILPESIEKHADAVYEMIRDAATSEQRAEYLSAALGRKISYQQVPSTEK